jgi:hypothetical protein
MRNLALIYKVIKKELAEEFTKCLQEKIELMNYSQYLEKLLMNIYLVTPVDSHL